MADSFTPNLNLCKPEVGAAADHWGNAPVGLNGDMDLLDAVFAAAGTGTAVGINVGTGKTLNAKNGTVVVTDTRFMVLDNADPTKGVQIDASGVTTGSVGTFKTPAANDTLVGLAATQTLTNKTLTSPILAGNPTVTTPPPVGDADTSVPNTAWVTAAITAAVGGVVVPPPIVTIATRKFTATGTYTPDPKMVFCVIEAWGGGGAGGGVSNPANITGGGGGGAGSRSKKTLFKAAVGASLAVTIGAGGVGASGVGTAGGDTSVGATCVAKGGQPGAVYAGGTYVVGGGLGGIAGTGDETYIGQRGGAAGVLAPGSGGLGVPPGRGGSTSVGDGGDATTITATTQAGNPGLGFGAGGAGAFAFGASGVANGGNGAPGYVTIIEYISS